MVWPYNWNVSLYVHWLSVTYNISDWICTLIWISRRTLLPTYFLCHLQMNNGSRTAAAAQSVPKDDFGAKPVWYHSPKKEKGRKWPLKMKTHFGIVQKEKIYWSLMIRLNWISEFASSSSLLKKKSILLTFSIFSGSKKKIPCPLWVKILDNVSLTNFPFMVRWRPWPPFPDFDDFFPIFLCWIFLQKLLWL